MKTSALYFHFPACVSQQDKTCLLDSKITYSNASFELK